MIELLIKADNAADLIATINGLSNLGGHADKVTGRNRPAPSYESDAPAESETVSEIEVEVAEPTRSTPPVTDPPKNKGGRTRKVQEPALSATTGDTSEPQPATSDAKSASNGSGDVFSRQIKQANAEAAAERQGDNGVVTMETLNSAFAQVIGSGKKFPSMKDAQDYLKGNFTSAAGEPCRRLGEVQTGDYDRLLAALQA